MDFSTLKPRESASTGAWLTVLHPVTQEETDFRIHLRGADSPEAERFLANIEKKNAGKPPTMAKRKMIGVDLLVHLTLGWEGAEDNGKPVAFSADAARDLYAEHSWLREQVDAFVADRGNFLKTS